MPRTTLTKVTAAAYGAGIADNAATAVDQPNGNDFVNEGKTILQIINGSGGNVVVTVTTPATSRSVNEAVTKTLTVATAKTGTMGPFPPGIFNQSGGKVNVDYDTGASITIAAIYLEPTPG